MGQKIKIKKREVTNVETNENSFLLLYGIYSFNQKEFAFVITEENGKVCIYHCELTGLLDGELTTELQQVNGEFIKKNEGNMTVVRSGDISFALDAENNLHVNDEKVESKIYHPKTIKQQ